MTASAQAPTAPDVDLEAVYERLATAIDTAGEARATVYLAKVVLLLAARSADCGAVLAALDAALADL